MCFSVWMCLHQVLTAVQVSKDPSIRKAHTSYSEIVSPVKFLRIRQEECNRILKLKCNPGRIWSLASLWTATHALPAASLFG